MGKVRRFLPEKIPVRPSLLQPPVAFPAPFPQGKGNGAIRKLPFDFSQQLTEPVVGKGAVLAPLQHKGAKAQGIADFAAGEDLLLGQSVANYLPIALADAAVVAVVFTDIGDFNQAPDKDPIAEPFPSSLPGGGIEPFFLLPV